MEDRALSELSPTVVRRAMRLSVDWPGRCRFGASSDWADCRLVDLSITGVALRFDVSPPDGGPVTVEFTPPDGGDGFLLRGAIKNRRPCGTVVGVAFDHLALNDELSLAALLTVLATR